MNTQRKEFTRFIKLLSDNDCLEHVILIGSWAEFMYRELGLLKGFEPNIKTLDIDFLLKNLRRPVPSKNLVVLAREAGYLTVSDYISGTTKILDKSGLEIEFLINKVGAGFEMAVHTNLGVTAQTLRHMNILSSNVVRRTYMGMTINIPLPEAYALHKMVINHERGRKQEKDRQAILAIWPYLDRNVFAEALSKLTKKEKKRVEAFMNCNNLK